MVVSTLMMSEQLMSVVRSLVMVAVTIGRTLAMVVVAALGMAQVFVMIVIVIVIMRLMVMRGVLVFMMWTRSVLMHARLPSGCGTGLLGGGRCGFRAATLCAWQPRHRRA